MQCRVGACAHALIDVGSTLAGPRGEVSLERGNQRGGEAEASHSHTPFQGVGRQALGVPLRLRDQKIAEGDKVVCRNLWRATSSGKKIEFRGIVIWRLAGGKIVERWASVSAPS